MTLHLVKLETVITKSERQLRRSRAGSYPDAVTLLRLQLHLNSNVTSSSGKNGLLRESGSELRLQHPDLKWLQTQRSLCFFAAILLLHYARLLVYIDVFLFILSYTDYCNTLFYNLPEYLLHKLTKVWYFAVRFMFGLRVTALRMHMQRYLKRLHFLPVRIEFKIALLTHKCLHGYVPTFLKNLISSSAVSIRYSLRVNDDNWLLQTVTSFHFPRSQSMFLYASPKVWNSLPLSLRQIETLYLFK